MGQGGIVLEGHSVGDAVVAEELCSTTEGVEENNTILQGEVLETVRTTKDDARLKESGFWFLPEQPTAVLWGSGSSRQLLCYWDPRRCSRSLLYACT